MDVAQVKQRTREVWGLGEYAELGRLLRPAAEALCDACAVSIGQDVLDVAAGDGNFAIAAAREGARVVASDLSPVMVERGRRRSDEEGLAIEWREADAEELPFEDESFDCVGSVFGAMIAPRPARVAAELSRIARPGGTIGMTAWTPDSLARHMFDIGRRYVPPPEDLPLPHEWGDEEVVQERFAEVPASVDSRRLALTFAADSPEAMVERLISAGPQVAARQSLPPERYEAMHAEWVELARSWNAAEDGSFQAEAEYLLTVARKRG
jgi:SAM-dependent methyltransferase